MNELLKRMLEGKLMDAAGDNGGEGGGGAPNSGENWREMLPDDLKTSPTLASVKDIPSLAKQYVDAQKYIGGSIRIPSEDAGQEDWSAFYEKVNSKVGTLMRKPDPEDEQAYVDVLKGLGMPESKEGYKVEGADENDASLNLMRELAANANMTTKQFQKAYSAYKEKMDAQTSESQAKLKESRDNLMREWGVTFEDKERKAINTLKQTGAPKSLIESAEKGEVGAETMKWALSIAQSLGSEGSPTSSDGKGESTKMTPGEAAHTINEIMNNKEHAYWNSRNPGHKEAVNRMVELHRMANPS